jgi:hypothetical protein
MNFFFSSKKHQINYNFIPFKSLSLNSNSLEQNQILLPTPSGSFLKRKLNLYLRSKRIKAKNRRKIKYFLKITNKQTKLINQINTFFLKKIKLLYLNKPLTFLKFSKKSLSTNLIYKNDSIGKIEHLLYDLNKSSVFFSKTLILKYLFINCKVDFLLPFHTLNMLKDNFFLPTDQIFLQKRT